MKLPVLESSGKVAACSTLSLYARNSVTMGSIDQSHALKASDVITSAHFVISRPGTGPGG